jgi:hypothetical protein
MAEFVLGSTFAGGLFVLSNPLAFQALLKPRYPEPAPKAQRAANLVDAARRFEARRCVSPAIERSAGERRAA